MTSLRTLVLSSVLSSLVLGAACTPDAPPKSAAVEGAPPPGASAVKTVERDHLPIDDPHALPTPGSEGSKSAPLEPSAKGTFDVMIDGQAAHLMSLPRGQNRAVWVPEPELARVSLAAADPGTGLPHLRLLIEGVRPDQAQYPVTITARAKSDAKSDAKAPKAPSLTIRYKVTEQRVYVIDTAKDANVELTLEGFEGSTLRGRFAGKLAPTAAGLGAPISISGEFAVELGLQGVEPALPSDPPTDSPADSPSD